MDQLDWFDSTDESLWWDSTERRLIDDPMDRKDAKEPTLATDSADPTDPMLSTEPSDHSDSTLLRDWNDRRLAMTSGWLGLAQDDPHRQLYLRRNRHAENSAMALRAERRDARRAGNLSVPGPSTVVRPQGLEPRTR
ncbi:hypothetical protein GCM10023350_14150 [Nocardioides endophyticus]|uniref:Uncharacterized protein n=1 Tax=Nocardioides endophyticus TaxID=1353775 RepID=A0ABP8YLR8_9ACTN